MFNWFRDMRRKQKESDRLLDMQVQDKRQQLKNSAMNLIVDCKGTIKNTMLKYNITQEDLDAFVGTDVGGGE